MRRLILLLLSLAAMGAALSGCPSPATPPAPPAEIPSSLTIPRDLSIDVDELPGSTAAAALKLQTIDPSAIKTAIEIAVGSIQDMNRLLDFALFPASQATIPVGVSVFNFENKLENPEKDQSLDFKFDFRRFDLDGDGALESCSNCTCPVGCAPDLAVCPPEAPESELHPICIRVWVNGERFLAGVFDRVPTEGHQESGRMRLALPSFGDLAGSPFHVVYDHRNPFDRLTDLSAFFLDSEIAGGTEFFGNRHSVGRIEGPEETAKKSAKLTSSFLSPPSTVPGLLQFQGRYFTHLDFISLEVLADGLFGNNEDEGGLLGAPDITPPICAQITTSNPVADILCTDLGLTLTPGEFLDLPLLEDVLLPPASEFPETPTF